MSKCNCDIPRSLAGVLAATRRISDDVLCKSARNIVDNNMRVDLSVLVFVLICFGDVLGWDHQKSTANVQERFSKVRYLITEAEDDVETARPLFYWESAPISASSTENSQFTVKFPISDDLVENSDHQPRNDNRKKRKNRVTKNKKKKKLLIEPAAKTDTTGFNQKVTKNKKRCHTDECKRKRKQRRRHKKNKKVHESNVLEIPKMARNITNVSSWNIKNDSSIQDVILKLNKNPESSYKNLLGEGVAEDEIKISHPKSRNGRVNLTSSKLPNLNASNINRNDYKNDTRILLDPRDKATAFKKISYKTHFYDPSVLYTTAPTISIFKSGFNDPQDKTSSKNGNWMESTWREDSPKINRSELMKLTKGEPVNISLTRFQQEFGDVSNNLDALETNRIHGYFGKSFNYSVLKNENKYRRFSCGMNNGGCAQICSEYGNRKCSCLEGFRLGGDGSSCFDIDECFQNNGGCESLCYNILGSFFCGCPAGLRIGDDLKSCEDINECLLRNGHGPCQGICTNTFGSYFCGCSDLNGTRLAPDKHMCEDVNECKEGKSGCSHGCINTHGRAFCTCPNGMQLGADWKTCNDINECEDEAVLNRCRYGCLNTMGSYHCLDLHHEQNDQIPTAPENISCPPMLPPQHGFFHCSRKKAALGGFKTKDGRKRITNRPGTFCELVCPAGFKNVGDFSVVCGYDGRWIGKRKGKCSPSPKPSIKCPGPVSVQLSPGDEIAHITFPPPKTNVDWRFVESEPVSAKNLEMFLPHGHHWITFKATNPSTQLSAKCIIYIVIRKTKMPYRRL